MEIIFLGTSSGVPTKARNVSGAAIRLENSKSWYLIDCGEGTQHQILKTPFSLNSLHTIFITHVHGDHCYGLPGLLASATMSGRTKTLNIIGPPELKEFLDLVLTTTQVRLSYEIVFHDVNSIDKYKNDEFTVNTCALSHRVPSWAYEFKEKKISRSLNTEKLKTDGIESGPFWGKLQQGENVELEDGRMLQAENYLNEGRRPRKVIISGDNDSPHLLAANTENLDVLVHEATYTKAVAEKVGNVPQHSYAKLVAQFADTHGIPNLILTHFSARYHGSDSVKDSIGELEQEAKENYRGNLYLANDLDIFYLNKDGVLQKGTSLNK